MNGLTTVIVPFLVALGLLVVVYAALGCALWLAGRLLERRERPRERTRSFQLEAVADDLDALRFPVEFTARRLAESLTRPELIPDGHRRAVEARRVQLDALAGELQGEADSLYGLVTQLRAGEPEWSGLDRRPTALQEREA